MSEPIVYWGGDFVPKGTVAVSPDDRAFLLGDGVYDVMRAVEGQLFQREAHLERLRRNLEAVELPAGDLDLGRVAEEVLERNTLTRGEAAVYVQVTRGAAVRTHAFPRPAPPASVYVFAWPFEPRRAWHERGIRVITVPDVRWARCDLKTTCLLPNVLAVERAKRVGADEALFVRDGVVLEGAHTSFFAVHHGALLTAPLSNYILPGITRMVVLGLARDLGIEVREGPLFADRLEGIEEAFVTGTTTDISPVVAVDGRPVGVGSPGPVTRRLQEVFLRILRGSESNALSGKRL